MALPLGQPHFLMRHPRLRQCHYLHTNIPSEKIHYINKSNSVWYKKALHRIVEGYNMFALPIFPGSHPPSIVSVRVLNFCVRDGNRWTHTTINTNLLTLVTHTGFEPMLTA